LVRSCRKELEQSGRIVKPERVTGRDGKEYPAAIEQEPRGKQEAPSSEKSEGGGGGGRPSSKGDGGAPGGSNAELEREARAMVRRGEMNPFELKNMLSATPHDYASVVVNLLNTMRPDDPKRNEGLLRIKRWIERVLSGEIKLGQEPEWSGEASSAADGGPATGVRRSAAAAAGDDEEEDGTEEPVSGLRPEADEDETDEARDDADAGDDSVDEDEES
jgi:hypothetical protein